jgi:hypothetical protein
LIAHINIKVAENFENDYSYRIGNELLKDIIEQAGEDMSPVPSVSPTAGTKVSDNHNDTHSKPSSLFAMTSIL